jgi:hypothetical protein
MSLPDGISSKEASGVREASSSGSFCRRAAPSNDQFLRGPRRHAGTRGTPLPDPAGRYTGLARFFLDVGNRFRVRLDLLLHAIEFGQRLLPIVSDL